ncbi:MAG: hypothetical protein OXE04_06090, partial [bacterium]|nr:hypothetical protein [bacterium]
PYDCRVEGSGPDDGRWLDPVDFGDVGMFPLERTCLRTRQPLVFEGELSVGALKAQSRDVKNSPGEGRSEWVRGPWGYAGARSEFVDLGMSAHGDVPRISVFGPSGVTDSLGFDDGVASRRKRSGAHVSQVCFNADVSALKARFPGLVEGDNGSVIDGKGIYAAGVQVPDSEMLAHYGWWRKFFRNVGIPETGFSSWCIANPNGPGTLQADAITNVAEWARVAAGVPVAVAQSDGTYAVPADWGLIPSGVNVGDRFRLLFVSSTKRAATSSDIADYDAHVRDALRSGRNAASVFGHVRAWRAVASTLVVDARVHTMTRSSDMSAQVWWLGGSRIATRYGPSNAQGSLWANLHTVRPWENWGFADVRDENGRGYTGNPEPHRYVWTGTDQAGEKANSALGSSFITVGSYNLGGEFDALFSGPVRPSDESWALYGLSPVYVVQAQQSAEEQQQQQPSQDQQTAQDTPQNEQSAYTVPADLIASVRGYTAETQHGDAHVQRWNRVLIAFGETVNGFTGTPMGATEAKTYADRGWTRWDPVVTALEALETQQAAQAQQQDQPSDEQPSNEVEEVPAEEPQTDTQQQPTPTPNPTPTPTPVVEPVVEPVTEQPPSYTVPADLITSVQSYTAETQHGDAHVQRWNRVLVAFGETVNGFTGTPMGATEAKTYADRGWTRWDPVVTALEALETQQIAQTQPSDEQPSNEVEEVPAEEPQTETQQQQQDPVPQDTQQQEQQQQSEPTPTPTPTPTSTPTATPVVDGPVVTLENTSAVINENGGGYGFYVVWITLNKPVDHPVSVYLTYQTTGVGDGHATAGEDFTVYSKRITIPAGYIRNAGGVWITDDNEQEPNETLQLLITNPQGATIGNNQTTLTIQDND